jgi:hypothetical protein
MKSEPMSCNRCNEAIYFDDDYRSSRGKKIPLDAKTKEPHDCPASDYNKRVTPEQIGVINERLDALETRITELEEEK